MALRAAAIPNLESLVLTNNRLANLQVRYYLSICAGFTFA